MSYSQIMESDGNPDTWREREREETDYSARVFQMRVRGWWSHWLIILQSDQTLSNKSRKTTKLWDGPLIPHIGESLQ